MGVWDALGVNQRRDQAATTRIQRRRGLTCGAGVAHRHDAVAVTTAGLRRYHGPDASLVAQPDVAFGSRSPQPWRRIPARPRWWCGSFRPCWRRKASARRRTRCWRSCRPAGSLTVRAKSGAWLGAWGGRTWLSRQLLRCRD
eukprot:363371-Chlamydomonas_euryale.AAC.9